METNLIVRCPVCEAERSVAPGEFTGGDMPLCENDGMPMLAARANPGVKPTGAAKSRKAKTIERASALR